MDSLAMPELSQMTDSDQIMLLPATLGSFKTDVDPSQMTELAKTALPPHTVELPQIAASSQTMLVPATRGGLSTIVVWPVAALKTAMGETALPTATSTLLMAASMSR